MEIQLRNKGEGVNFREVGTAFHGLLEKPENTGEVWDQHLPLSPSKRPWWRITAKVRKDERGKWIGVTAKEKD